MKLWWMYFHKQDEMLVCKEINFFLMKMVMKFSWVLFFLGHPVLYEFK